MMRRKTPFPISVIKILTGLTAGFIFLLLGGCTALDAQIQADTGAQNASATPEEPILPTEETPAPTLIPTNTPALLPTSQSTSADETLAVIEETAQPENAIDFGTAELAIIRPGQLSRLVSPIRVIVNLKPGPDRLIEMTLYGEDGRILFNEADYAHPFDDPVNGNLIKDLEFSIDGLVETGRLEFKVYDEFGRMKALNSVYLILLSSGISDRNFAPETADRIVLQLPFPDQLEIHASPIFTSGLVRTASETPLFVSLVDEHGETLGEGRASVVLTPGSEYGQFVGEIPYTVSEPTSALLTFGMKEGRISGYTFIKTIEVILYPP
ncbi:hypothetical protein KQH61_05210 [bacterium]|nr:hypothetical protein [bacterium]MCB2179299.1 hypothetical protein [bacterium]